MPLPFALPVRPAVTRLRRHEPPLLATGNVLPRQAMAGYDPQFSNIVDYIVGITDEIWRDRAVGRIYDTYDASCTIYSSYGMVKSVEEVISSTIIGINAFPDGDIQHLNVAWSGDENEGFYTSHLGHSRSTNLGRTSFGPATGRRTSVYFVADCISHNNLIHTEWLVRDNGAAVRQLGFDIHETARKLALSSNFEQFIVAPDAPQEAKSVPVALDLPADTIDGWARHLFHNLWNIKRLDWLARYYDPAAVVHAGGGRVATGLATISTLLIHIQAAIPDGVMRVGHVCFSEESDGVIIAVRWVYEGMTNPGGVLGECPSGKPVFMMGSTHMRIENELIVEEWMIFDELGVLAQAYRA